MCRQVLRQAESGTLEIVTSAFTLAEVCKKGDVRSGAENLPAFFDQDYILLVSVDDQIGRRAQALQQAGLSGLKPPDAVHLASALIANVSAFHTFDQKLLNLDGKLVSKHGQPLAITRPTEDEPLPPLLEGLAEPDTK